MNYYIADCHFGHENIIRFDNRPFSDVEEMDLAMIALWNQRVTERDDVYILGDFCFRSRNDPAWYLRQLKGKKHLIQGNHDAATLEDANAMEHFVSVDKMRFVKDNGKNLVLCHFPIAEWNGYHKGAWHIYGHIHGRVDAAGRYMREQERALNAGCMLNGYQPATMQELIRNNQNLRPTKTVTEEMEVGNLWSL